MACRTSSRLLLGKQRHCHRTDILQHQRTRWLENYQDGCNRMSIQPQPTTLITIKPTRNKWALFGILTFETLLPFKTEWVACVGGHPSWFSGNTSLRHTTIIITKLVNRPLIPHLATNNHFESSYIDYYQ